MGQISVNGAEIAFQQLGEGPDLVFVHGLAASRAFWFVQYALPLSQHFRITLFDLRGHGYSSRPAGGYDAPTMAGDLAALLDHLQIEQCALVGHSYGGGVALDYACAHPERVSRLVLLDTKVNSLQPQQRLSDSEHLTPFEVAVANKSGHDWEQEPQVGLLFLEVVARQRLAGDDTGLRDAFTPFGEGRGAQRAAKSWLELLDTTSAREDFLVAGHGAEAIAALKMPVLLIYGQHSRCMPSLRALRPLLPSAELEVIPEAGHFFPLSHGAMTLKRLSRFLGLPEDALPMPKSAAA